jgi:hypothetical protein
MDLLFATIGGIILTPPRLTVAEILNLFKSSAVFALVQQDPAPAIPACWLLVPFV